MWRFTRRSAFASAFQAAAVSQPARSVKAADEPKLLSLFDFERAAQARLPAAVWARISGGAADEITLRWNHEAYEHIKLNPRVLVDVSHIDTSLKLFDHELPFPILLAPTGAQSFLYPNGELEAVRGAAQARTILSISTSAALPIQDIAKAATGPVWFQLYVQRDRGLTKDLVQRAESVGCRALVVTVDTSSQGARNREQGSQGNLPPRPWPNLKGGNDVDPALTWKDIDWLRSLVKMPVLLKGVLNPDDAATAVTAGVSGIIVSNHGARNLDTAPATIEVLPSIAARVKRRVPLLIDGGIRRGTDILKAIALGATAVQIGRPYLWGLSLNGSDGVAQVVELLRREFVMAMALCGKPSLAHLDPSALL
jgi:4-hydroxymandelate oxidase